MKHQAFLTFACFTIGKEPPVLGWETSWTPEASMNILEVKRKNPCPYKKSNLDHPAHSKA
jgi:hypothetical protein